MSDPFGPTGRQAQLNRATADYDQRVTSILREIDDDLSSRGPSCTDHPMLGQVYGALHDVVTSILDFDSRTADILLKRAKLDPTNPPQNPFCEANEASVKTTLSSLAEAIPATIARKSRMLISNDQIDQERLQAARQFAMSVHCDIVTSYAQKRAEFEVDLANAMSARTPTPPPAGLEENSKPRVVLANEARDKWLYHQFCKKERGAPVPYKVILGRLKEVAKRRHWTVITDISSLKAAANRWADRNNQPPIPRRQAGRRPSDRTS